MGMKKVSAKGAIVVPVELRRKYDLHEGSRVELVDYGGVLAIVPAMAKPIQESRGMLKGGRSLLNALKEERRQNS